MNISGTIKIFQCMTIILLMSVKSHAFAEKYLFVSDLDHRYHQKIVALIESELNDQGHDIDNISHEDFDSSTLDEYSSLITIGYQAAVTVIQDTTDKPVLSLLIPKLAFNRILKKNINKEKRYLFSSIYIDQPVKRQISLINELSSNFRKIGVLYGKNSYSRKNEITTIVKKAGLGVKNITVLERTELISETRHLSENSDILLAIPDNTIYNRRSIKGILLTTYRNKIPVIGFSRAYVKAGALAAVYSSPDNISKHAIEVLNHNTRHSYISASRYHPKYFEVEINTKVARSLNISLQSKDTLLKQLINLEADSSSTYSGSKGAASRG